MENTMMEEYRAAVIEYSKLINGIAASGTFTNILDARLRAAAKRCERARDARNNPNAVGELTQERH
jgi:hypothetical protein